MRASSARLTNSPVRLADLAFPQTSRLIHRTRLAFIHLDNLLAFAKRDRDGRIDGFLAVHLPDECLLVFLREGEAVNAASMHSAGRHVITMGEALKRMRAEVERGELTYCAAPMEQLAWMYESCAAAGEARPLDSQLPGELFPALAEEKVSGVLELISNGRVSYLRFGDGKYNGGYFCDKPDAMAVPKYIESLFQPGMDGAAPRLSAMVFPAVPELPAQAPNALVSTYRELYWRIVDAVDREIPGEGSKRAQRIATALAADHAALALLTVPPDAEVPDAVVRPDDLVAALSDWTLQLLEGVEIMMPGTAPRVLHDCTREHRYVLQAAGFYGRLPWQVTW